tara:strand:+ start:1440 stop:1910 length:471 start_codon:yes stop_codon:yes gene_type:complete
MTTPLINPASIRISFLSEEGSLTEVSGPTLGAVAIAISAELQRRDRNYREPVIVMESGRIPCDAERIHRERIGMLKAFQEMREEAEKPAPGTEVRTIGLLEYQAMREDQNDDDDDEPSPDECDQCSSTEVSPGYTSMGMLCYDCRDAYRGDYTEVE